jgi:Integrase core domain
LAGFEAGGVVIAVEETTIVQGERVRAAAAAARALAYRRFLHQPMRHVLLLVQHSGRVQPFPRAWDLRESMREADVEVILERAKEKYPEAKPRIVSDNGPQFIARDFKEFIRISGMTHVRTSPSYPQSNGKLERWHESLKSECIRPRTPLSLQDAKRLIQQYVDRYNNVRLHNAIGYVTPKDMLAGRQVEIHTERDRKLEAARQQRQSRRQQAA